MTQFLSQLPQFFRGVIAPLLQALPLRREILLQIFIGTLQLLNLPLQLLVLKLEVGDLRPQFFENNLPLMRDNLREDFLDSLVHMHTRGPIVEHSTQYFVILDMFEYCLNGFFECLVFGLQHVEVVLALLFVEALEL